MKKFYLLILALAISSTMSFGQKILVLAATIDNPTVIKIADSVKAAWPGITTEIVNVAGILEWTAENFQDYDAAVLTEEGGSGSHGNFGIVGAHTIPFVCLKAYAIKKNYPQWHWIAGTADDWFAQAKDTLQADWDLTYTGIVEDASHPIFGGLYEDGDEFVWTTGWDHAAVTDPHIQCVDLSKSHDAIKNASTMIASNKFAKTETISAVDGWLWAVEENDSSKKGVVWGVHHLLLGQTTPEFSLILQNSLAWVLDHEIPNVFVPEDTVVVPDGIYNNMVTNFNLKAYPNPANESVTISFTIEKTSTLNLVIKDILGKTMYNLENTFDAGEKSVEIDLSNFPSGLYMYQVISEGLLQTKSLVLN